MENGTLRMGILKTKGLRPLVQNRFPFATKMPIRNIPFSIIRGILDLRLVTIASLHVVAKVGISSQLLAPMLTSPAAVIRL